MPRPRPDRRELLAGAAAGAGLALLSRAARAAQEKKRQKQPDIPPTEDLMREHGVLRRILLVYDEAARRLGAGDAAVAGAIAGAAGIVSRFVESYHEKLEEEMVFPRLEKAGKLIVLVKILRDQHAAGRRLTEAILKAARPRPGQSTAMSTAERGTLAADMQSFGRMYAPHAAREDTDLFPAYRALFTEAELDELGERFEEQEHKLLGSGGFEGSLREVTDLEKALGIHDLARYTPR